MALGFESNLNAPKGPISIKGWQF